MGTCHHCRTKVTRVEPKVLCRSSRLLEIFWNQREAFGARQSPVWAVDQFGTKVWDSQEAGRACNLVTEPRKKEQREWPGQSSLPWTTTPACWKRWCRICAGNTGRITEFCAPGRGRPRWTRARS